ncbi:MAG: hypothetical protein ACRC42_04920 [Mycoplasma sp.]
MIKELHFKRLDTLDPNSNILKVNFDVGVNIIIGPKGGGKSTLFDLVASLKSGFISKNVTDALAAFNLEFVKAITFSNEEIMLNSILKKNAKEKEREFSERNDVIFQDDPIKKNINTLKEIDSQKYNFIRDLLNESESIKKFLDELSGLHLNIQKICKLNQDASINWSNAFKMIKIKDKLGVITKLNYSNSEFNIILQKEIGTLQEILENAKQQKMHLTRYLSYNFNTIQCDQKFNEELSTTIKYMLEKNEDLIQILSKKIKFHKTCLLASKIFKNSYNNLIDKIKKKDFNNEGLKIYETQAKDYFKKTARQIFETKNLFQKLLLSEVSLNIEPVLKNHEFLSYKFDENALLSDDKIDDILVSFLYVPPKSKNSITKWILENLNKDKGFNQNTILNKIANVLKDDVKVLANGVDYETMSLGQKSIYGIKYKFMKSDNCDLFLDQPEDNLDNHTIATNILDLIKERDNQNKQIFIVTHNANIGILTNPKRVIVADLNNPNEQYSCGTIKHDENRHSDSAHYLEGGVEFIQKRLDRIKGE